MSEGDAPNNANETTGAPGTTAQPTGDIINPPKTKADFRKVKGLGWALIIIPIILIFLIIALWPPPTPSGPVDAGIDKLDQPQQEQKAPGTTGTTQTGEPGDSPPPQQTNREDNSMENGEGAEEGGIIGLNMPFQLRMILLVLLGGALGSYIHVATSYSYYIGFNKFDMDWFWWYLLRIPMGAVLALIFLMLIQGGMFTVPDSGSGSEPLTLIGLSALVGMFSRQATEKLKEVFDIIFKTRESEMNKEEQDKKNKAKQG